MRRRHVWIVGIVLLTWSAIVAADAPMRIEVFTVSGLPIKRTEGAEMHVVDALHTLTQDLGRDLPKNGEQAKEIVLARLQSPGTNLHERARRAAVALTRAAQLRIDRVPAVVFDAKWVVYGVPDVGAAHGYLKRVLVRKSVPHQP